MFKVILGSLRALDYILGIFDVVMFKVICGPLRALNYIWGIFDVVMFKVILVVISVHLGFYRKSYLSKLYSCYSY